MNANVKKKETSGFVFVGEGRFVSQVEIFFFWKHRKKGNVKQDKETTAHMNHRSIISNVYY